MTHPDDSIAVIRFFQYSTEETRRLVFWARYQADHLGSQTIEAEHILLGLIQQDASLVSRFLSPGSSMDQVRADLARSVGATPELLASAARSWQAVVGQSKSTARELRLSSEGARLFARAVDVAEEERRRKAAASGVDAPPAVPNPGQGWSGEGPPSPELIEALRKWAEASQQGDPGYVKPRHLLLACLSMPGIPCERILTEHGLRLEDVKQIEE